MPASEREKAEKALDEQIESMERAIDEADSDAVGVPVLVQPYAMSHAILASLRELKELRSRADPKEKLGIIHKFNVTRTDGRSAPGEKHDGCSYFVLDLHHDPFAWPAIDAYAKACEKEYPALASDLRQRFVLGAERPQQQAEPKEKPISLDECKDLLDALEAQVKSDCFFAVGMGTERGYNASECEEVDRKTLDLFVKHGRAHKSGNVYWWSAP